MDGEWLVEEPGNTEVKVKASRAHKAPVPSAARVPKENAKPKVDIIAIIRTLPIRGLTEAEAECLLSIALDAQRIQLRIKGITYPYDTFPTLKPEWFGPCDALIDDVKPIRTDTIDEAIMELSRNSYVVLSIT